MLQNADIGIGHSSTGLLTEELLVPDRQTFLYASKMIEV